MQKIDSLLGRAGQGLTPVSSASPIAAGQTEKSAKGKGAGNEPDLVDAINQLFAEFELAYHNQYYKAYSTDERLILAKKYWKSCLAEFSPRQIVAAGHKLVMSQDYLPSVSAMVRACEEGTALFGLPAVREAYIEACRAPAPKAAWPWQHPAVYFAGKAADWHFLASEPEDKTFPVFAHYYRDLCQRVMRGEELDKPTPPALPERPSKPLDAEEQQRRMAHLRATLDL